jgi:hypothetical protein
VKNATLSCTSPDYSAEVCDALGLTDPIHAKACGQVHWPPNKLTQVRRKRVFSFAMSFDTQNDRHFVKTGSGPNYLTGKHSKKESIMNVFLAGP